MGPFEALLSAVSVVSGLVSGPALPAPTPSPALHGTWPVQPHQIARGFEPPSATWAAGHRGVDLHGAIGTAVVASLAGTVTFAGVIAGRGVLVISHGETRTTYEPVVAEVRRGAAVGAGDRVGTRDVTQSHCFPAACLHWGWIRGTEYLDPLRLVVADGRVRLLPLTPVDALADKPS